MLPGREDLPRTYLINPLNPKGFAFFSDFLHTHASIFKVTMESAAVLKH